MGCWWLLSWRITCLAASRWIASGQTIYYSSGLQSFLFFFFYRLCLFIHHHWRSSNTSSSTSNNNFNNLTKSSDWHKHPLYFLLWRWERSWTLNLIFSVTFLCSTLNQSVWKCKPCSSPWTRLLTYCTSHLWTVLMYAMLHAEQMIPPEQFSWYDRIYVCMGQVLPWDEPVTHSASVTDQDHLLWLFLMNPERSRPVSGQVCRFAGLQSQQTGEKPTAN